MKIFDNINEWMHFRSSLTNQDSLGFVPTMGNLHPGHASLVAASKKENTLTAVSIFINPTQFNNTQDFTHYPRTIEADINLLTESGVDFCIIPTEQAIYNDKYNYQVQEHSLCQLMEGKHRPGHFNGVLTVVMKLLNIVRPHRAYFGEKDYQQYLLIKNMVEAFFMNIEIKPCPTIREQSSLAFSSRNNRLSKEQRVLADLFASIFHQDKSCEQITNELENHGICVEYIEAYAGRKFAAVRIGDIRLIDNY